MLLARGRGGGADGHVRGARTVGCELESRLLELRVDVLDEAGARDEEADRFGREARAVLDGAARRPLELKRLGGGRGAKQQGISADKAKGHTL